jgi:hypothetical protein
MAATYLGGVTIGGAVVGLETVFGQVGGALTTLRATVAAQITAIDQANALIAAQLSLLGVAKIAIRIPATIDFQAQLDASLQISASLGLQLTDPSAYLSGLLAGLAQVQLSVSALVPTIAIQTQIAVAAATTLAMNAKIGAVDIELAALDTIAIAISAKLTALTNITAALSAALAVVGAAITAYLNMTTTLGTAGAHVILYTGALSGIGAAVDAVTAGTGLAGGDDVRASVILVETSDAGRVAAFNAVLKTS